MAPSGFRSSWESVARNSSLARFASAADARQIADTLQQPHVVVRDRPALAPPDHEEAPDGLFLDTDGHEQIGLVGKPVQGVTIDPRVGCHVVRPHSPSRLPGLFNRRVVFDGDRELLKGRPHVFRHAITGDGLEIVAVRAG